MTVVIVLLCADVILMTMVVFILHHKVWQLVQWRQAKEPVLQNHTQRLAIHDAALNEITEWSATTTKPRNEGPDA